MTSSEYVVRLHAAAQKDLDRLPEKLRSRVISRLRILQTEPRPRGCTKLTGSVDVYRIRVGDYRILYRVLNDERIVNISRVVHRSKAYKR